MGLEGACDPSLMSATKIFRDIFSVHVSRAKYRQILILSVKFCVCESDRRGIIYGGLYTTSTRTGNMFMYLPSCYQIFGLVEAPCEVLAAIGHGRLAKGQQILVHFFSLFSYPFGN